MTQTLKELLKYFALAMLGIYFCKYQQQLLSATLLFLHMNPLFSLFV